MIFKIWKELVVLLLIFGAMWGAFSYYHYEVDSNPFAISAETETEMSDFMNEYLMKGLEVVDDPKVDSTLALIMNRLTAHMDTVSYEYQLHVVKNEQINAFTSLNGQIYVFTGLIDNLDEAEELAVILAHEIGHSEQKHVIEKIAKTIGMEAFFSIATGGDPVLISEVAKLGISTAFDRKNEEAADDFALDLAFKSGINPRRLGQFFIRLKGKDSSFLNDIEFIRTHPMDNDRIQKSSDFKLPADFQEEAIGIDWKAFQEQL